MLDRVHAVLDRIEAQQQERVVEARSALELLQSIYRESSRRWR